MCRDCERGTLGGEMRRAKVLKKRRSPRRRGRMGTGTLELDVALLQARVRLAELAGLRRELVLQRADARARESAVLVLVVRVLPRVVVVARVEVGRGGGGGGRSNDGRRVAARRARSRLGRRGRALRGGGRLLFRRALRRRRRRRHLRALGLRRRRRARARVVVVVVVVRIVVDVGVLLQIRRVRRAGGRGDRPFHDRLRARDGRRRALLQRGVPPEELLLVPREVGLGHGAWRLASSLRARLNQISPLAVATPAV
eukprot:31089-Pelagococcus_subviridis.AAC.13